MFTQTIALFTVAIAVASALRREGRIVGGTDATIEAYPYMLSLQFDGLHVCGASILNSNTAITAQNCLHNRNPFFFTLRAGSANRYSGGIIHLLSAIIDHPDYNTITLDNDISILKVAEAFAISGTVQPIGLPAHLDDLPGDTRAVIAGWGTTQFQGLSPDILQRADVPIIDRGQCLLWYQNNAGITDRQICAGEENYDACTGDLGGPLIFEGKIWGVISWGYECARFQRPTVFASTAYHRLWIDQYL